MSVTTQKSAQESEAVSYTVPFVQTDSDMSRSLHRWKKVSLDEQLHDTRAALHTIIAVNIWLAFAAAAGRSSRASCERHDLTRFDKHST
jgi:hypothetical protein